MGLTDAVPLKYTVTIRGLCTTVEKGKVTLIDGHSPHPCLTLMKGGLLRELFEKDFCHQIYGTLNTDGLYRGLGTLNADGLICH